MHDVQIVHGFEAFHELDEDLPDFCLWEGGVIFLMVTDFLEEVPVVSVLHDYATRVVENSIVTYQRD